MKTRLEDLSLLEERVETLVNRLEKSLKANADLQARLEKLDAEGDEASQALREENKKLHTQVNQLTDQVEQLTEDNDKLKAEVETSEERETQVKDRLQGILKKIDTMEDVLAGQAASE